MSNTPKGGTYEKEIAMGLHVEGTEYVLDPICPGVRDDVRDILSGYPKWMLVDTTNKTEDLIVIQCLEILKRIPKTMICFNNSGTKLQISININPKDIDIGLRTIEIVGNRKLVEITKFIGTGKNGQRLRTASIHLPNGILNVNIRHVRDDLFAINVLKFESNCIRSMRNGIRPQINPQEAIKNFFNSESSIGDRIKEYIALDGILDEKAKVKKLIPVLDGKLLNLKKFKESDFLGVMSDISYYGMGFCVQNLREDMGKVGDIISVKLPFLDSPVIRIQITNIIKQEGYYEIGAKFMFKNLHDPSKDDVEDFVNQLDREIKDQLRNWREELEWNEERVK